MKKLFIYSLPRSGSTLIQKYLYRNNEVSTISEPWVLLPLYYMFKNGKVFSEYEHHLFMRSFSDLSVQGYDSKIIKASFIKAASDVYYKYVCDSSAKVFIDKTPRYSIICNEIINDFPEDYHILLFRHPLSCVSSMVNTFCNGNWGLYRFNVDLFLGLIKLNYLLTNKMKYPNLQVLRYEDFIANPEFYYESICTNLNLDSKNKVEMHVKPLFGTLGDPIGEKKFGTKVFNQKSEYSWSASFNTVYRRWWAKKLLKNIGEDSFLLMGYDFKKTIKSISGGNYSLIQELKDFPHIILGFMHRYTGLYVTYVKLKSVFRGVETFGER
jgi:hypothetical protein